MICAFSPSPVRTACATHSSLITGSMPGIAASTSETWEFGSPPNSVEAPENSFAFEVTWAWTSMPMTTSQSPVAPLISLCGLTGAFIDCGFRTILMWDGLGFAQRTGACQAAEIGIRVKQVRRRNAEDLLWRSASRRPRLDIRVHLLPLAARMRSEPRRGCQHSGPS